MLLNFRVSNFLSFNEEEEFSMVAGQVKGLSEHLVTLGEGSGELGVTKAAVVYGANGAGKSNLIKAVEFFQSTVSKGLSHTATSNHYFRLIPENQNRITKFEIEFSKNGKIFAYGFELLLNSKKFTSEWLYEIKKTSEKVIFERQINENGESQYLHKSSFKGKLNTRFEVYSSDVQDNELLLFILGKNKRPGFEQFHDPFNWITKDLIIIWPHSRFKSVHKLFQEEKIKDAYCELLRHFNTGINEIDFQNIDAEEVFLEMNEQRKAELESAVNPNGSVFINSGRGRIMVKKNDHGDLTAEKIITKHLNENGSNDIIFEFEEESDGTKRLFDLIPIIMSVKFGVFLSKTFLVDEIDRSLHPELTRKLLETFLNSNDSSQNQLILTTHESSLLDLNLLRRDEIWFVEKKKDSSSHLYSLEEFKPRFDTEIRKAYLQGRYGAIPFISDANQLGWN